MLSAIGESPVSSLNDPSLVDVSLAESILNETSIDIQSQGLHSNTEINFPMTPNVNGEILVMVLILIQHQLGGVIHLLIYHKQEELMKMDTV